MNRSFQVLLRGFLLWHFWPFSAPAADDTINCELGFHDWQNLWSDGKKEYCCDNFGRGCIDHPAHTEVVYHKVYQPIHQPPHIIHVPVPMPSHTHVVYKTHYVRPAPIVYQQQEHHFAYDCHEGYSNWYFGWSAHKKSWCCDHRSMGCPGTWHGSYHLHTHVFAAGVGHAEGRIYDCGAGFSNWMQGWSDSKKDWCCHQQSRGCVKFHCTSGAAARLLWPSLSVGCR